MQSTTRTALTFSEQHRACIDELRELQKKIKTIRDVLKDCRCRFETTATKADEIATRMNEVSTLVRPKRVALEKVRQEIIDAKTITICVSNDGAIEAPDNPEFVVNDEGFQGLKAEISEREECLDLRIRDIATLARLIKICEKVEHFSLICDNVELEKAFWAIR